MAVVKVKDREAEVDDEVAELVADPSGVPYKNRYAESKRKQDKAEKEAQELRERYEREKAEWQAKLAQAPAPYVPGQYQAPVQAGLSADDARRIAAEEARRFEQAREFEAEQARLREEWPEYEEEQEAVSAYLKSKGYRDEEIQNFGPRDKRLVKDAFKANKKPERVRRANPQEVILDTGASEVVEGGAPWDQDPHYWDKKSPADFREFMHKTTMKAALDDE